MLVCHVFRGKEAEAGIVRCEKPIGKWIFWLRDLDSAEYHNVDMYDSYDEACEKVLNNSALEIAHRRWIKRQMEYGFLAMEYDDVDLEAFASKHMKPAITESLQFKLKDMRDISQAGVIDLQLREALREAKFVVADLTHDNNGVYWEAGFAEALDKPTIYTCEKGKFEKVKTHFDTNHCTTILWSSDKPQKFREQFVSAIRRSLGL